MIARARPFLLAGIAAACSIEVMRIGLRGHTLLFLGIVVAGTASTLALALGAPLPVRPFVALGAALMIVAVALRPGTSRDLYAYEMYGRIVAVHHASPYTHVPSDFPSDPFLARVHPAFRDAPSVYGPVFTAVSAGAARIAGSSAKRARLLFQGMAALSMLGALVLVARRTRDGRAVALLGLHPVVAGSIVNGGHNDALVGIGVLGGALLALEHPIIASLVLALAAGIKVVALLPFGALTVWVWRRRGLRPAAVFVAPGVALLIAMEAFAGGLGALRPLRDASGYLSTQSIWHSVGRWIGSTSLAGRLGLGVVVVVTLLVVAASVRAPLDAPAVAGAATVPYLVGAPYALPWYAGWGLPALALQPRAPLTIVATLQTSALMLTYPIRAPDGHAIADVIQHNLARAVLPITEALALVALLFLFSRMRSFSNASPDRTDSAMDSS